MDCDGSLRLSVHASLQPPPGGSVATRGRHPVPEVTVKSKGKVFPYSLPSVGPGADPGVQVTHQLQVKRRTGKVRRPETDVLPLCHATNQGHSMKLYYPHSRVTARQNASSVRVVELWNKLPEELVSASSVSAFISRLNSMRASFLPRDAMHPRY